MAEGQPRMRHRHFHRYAGAIAVEFSSGLGNTNDLSSGTAWVKGHRDTCVRAPTRSSKPIDDRRFPSDNNTINIREQYER
jgi:hypothetical protein